MKKLFEESIRMHLKKNILKKEIRKYEEYLENQEWIQDFDEKWEIEEEKDKIHWEKQGELWEKEMKNRNLLKNWDNGFLKEIKKGFAEIKKIFEEYEDNGLKEKLDEIDKEKEGEETWIDIKKIKYSQYKINSRCKEDMFGERKNIYDTIKEVIDKEVKYEKREGKDWKDNKRIPYIEIVCKDRKIFSKDNRRLFILKEVLVNNENKEIVNEVINYSEGIRMIEDKIEIKCIKKNEDYNFELKRKQAKEENIYEMHNWEDVIVSGNARGKYFYF